MKTSIDRDRDRDKSCKSSISNPITLYRYTYISCYIYILLILTTFTLETEGGWIDVDTKPEAMHIYANEDKYPYKLVFSDEFNVNGRSFKDGSDPRWTAMHKNDYTNYALQYYNQDLGI